MLFSRGDFPLLTTVKLAVDSGLTGALESITAIFSFINDNSVLSILLWALVGGTLLGIVFSLFRK